MTRNIKLLLAAGLLAATQAAGAQAQQTPPPPAQHEHMHEGQAPSEQKTPLEFKGKVSDVWSAKVVKDSKVEDKIVLVETDQGQVIVADLGPQNALNVEIEEGMPALVRGQMMTVGGTRRFVPHDVKLGSQAQPSPAATVQTKPTEGKEPQKQKISGKVVEKKELDAKQTKVDQTLAIIEVDPRTRVVVDLGPADRLKSMDLDEGDRVEVDGEKTRINDYAVLIADQVQSEGKEVKIQRQAIPAATVEPATGEPPTTAPGQPPQQPRPLDQPE